jgi:hypothetical protein
MKRRIARATLTLLSTCAAAFETGSGIRYQTDSLRPLNMPPTFDHGYLAVYERGGVGIYVSSGTLQYRIPNPLNGSISNVAVDKDGTAATSVSFGSNRGAVWVWDSSGLNTRKIETADYVPSYVAFAPDGSIWTTGTQRRAKPPLDTDYLILRHFSREGELLGAFLPRSSFNSEPEPAEPVTALPALRIASGRIGMYFSGGGRKHGTWVETDLNGKELGRWLVNVDGYPAALTESGAVYTRSTGITYMLDRATGAWILAPVTSLGTLVGAAGDALVFADRSSPQVYMVSTTPR